MKSKELRSQFTFQIEEKHYIKHNYLTFCNDVLVDLLRFADANKLTNETIKFANKNDCDEFNKVSEENGDWQEWLLNNGYKDTLYNSYYKHVFFSLVSDFCSYMLESINCAAKMKVAVSYALLRKPLKDTLGFIEWLYLDKNEVIDLLVYGDPKNMEIKRDKAKEHTSAIEKIRGYDGFYSFRYDNKSKTSLEHIWNNANHLITTRNSLSKTEMGNLNFVFADETILREFSDYYYLVVPAIMMYATDLICDMFENMGYINVYTQIINKTNRVLKSSFVTGIDGVSHVLDNLENLTVPLVCPRCGLKRQITAKHLTKIQYGQFRCPRCRKRINTNRYIFEWEKVKIIDTSNKDEKGKST